MKVKPYSNDLLKKLLSSEEMSQIEKILNDDPSIQDKIKLLLENS